MVALFLAALVAAAGCTSETVERAAATEAPGLGAATSRTTDAPGTTAVRAVAATALEVAPTDASATPRIEVSARRVIDGQATVGSLSVGAESVLDAVGRAAGGEVTGPRETDAVWCSAIAWPDAVYVVRVAAGSAERTDGGFDAVELRTVATPVFGSEAPATATFVWDGVTHVSVDAVVNVDDATASGLFAATTGDGITFEGAFRCAGD
ncbi:MAG TPA: hypothetical protein VGK49_04840 [Ilumatobacteraceae bacterium]